MKVTESNPFASLNITGVSSPATRSVLPQTGSGPGPAAELSLTAASQAAFAGRPERVAELRALVSSGAYQPQTQGVVEKMIDEAVSRTD